MSPSARFALSYITVLTIMLAWWLGMKGAATVGPILLLVVAYALPVAAWWAVVVQTRGGQVTRHER